MKARERPSQRDEEFARFFSDTVGRVQSLARRITGNPWDAEDIAVETFARAYERWDRLANADWRTGWALKVCGNLAIDLVRRRRTVNVGGTAANGDVSTESFVQAADPIAKAVDRLALSAALAALPRREKEVVVLIGLCGCSHEHAARVLGVSTGSTKTYLHRAMRHLRFELGALAPEVT